MWFDLPSRECSTVMGLRLKESGLDKLSFILFDRQNCFVDVFPTICNASYIGETTRHICTRVREHLLSDKSSHIYSHLQPSRAGEDSCATECFTILNSATSKFQIKFKEALHIKWEIQFLISASEASRFVSFLLMMLFLFVFVFLSFV